MSRLQQLSLLFVPLGILAAVAVFIMDDDKPSVTQNQSESAAKSSTDKTLPDLPQVTLSQPLSMIPIQASAKLVQPQGVASKASQLSLWKLSQDDRRVQLDESIELNPHLLVDVDTNLALKLDKGKILEFELPGDKNIQVEITEERLESNGDYTMIGKVLNEGGNDYPVVLTQSDKGTYGSIATGTDTYTLTTVEGQGVIYLNPDLPDSDDDDFLVPPVPKVDQGS